MSSWASRADANRFGNIYLRGFLDISGGDFHLRNHNFTVNASDSSFNSNLQVSKNINIHSDANINGILNLSLTQSRGINFKSNPTSTNTLATTLLYDNVSNSSQGISNGNFTIKSGAINLNTNQTSEENPALRITHDSILFNVPTNSMKIMNDLSINQNLYVMQDISGNGNLNLTGHANILGNVYTNNIFINKLNFLQETRENKQTIPAFLTLFDSSFSESVDIEGTLNANIANIKGDIKVIGNTTLNSLTTDGSAVLNGRIDVNNDVSLNKNVSIKKLDVLNEIGGNILNISSVATINELNISGKGIFLSDISLNGNINAEKIITYDLSSDIIGANTLNIDTINTTSKINANGGIILKDMLSIYGDISNNTDSSSYLYGNTYFYGENIIFYKDISFNSNIHIDGNINAPYIDISNAQINELSVNGNINANKIIVNDISLNIGKINILDVSDIQINNISSYGNTILNTYTANNAIINDASINGNLNVNKIIAYDGSMTDLRVNGNFILTKGEFNINKTNIYDASFTRATVWERFISIDSSLNTMKSDIGTFGKINSQDISSITLTVVNTTDICGNLNIRNNTRVNNNLTVGGTLSVSGLLSPANISVTGNINTLNLNTTNGNIFGNVISTNLLNNYGDTHLRDAYINGITNLKQDLNANNNINFNGISYLTYTDFLTIPTNIYRPASLISPITINFWLYVYSNIGTTQIFTYRSSSNSLILSYSTSNGLQIFGTLYPQFSLNTWNMVTIILYNNSTTGGGVYINNRFANSISSAISYSTTGTFTFGNPNMKLKDLRFYNGDLSLNINDMYLEKSLGVSPIVLYPLTNKYLTTIINASGRATQSGTTLTTNNVTGNILVNSYIFNSFVTAVTGLNTYTMSVSKTIDTSTNFTSTLTTIHDITYNSANNTSTYQIIPLSIVTAENTAFNINTTTTTINGITTIKEIANNLLINGGQLGNNINDELDLMTLTNFNSSNNYLRFYQKKLTNIDNFYWQNASTYIHNKTDFTNQGFIEFYRSGIAFGTNNGTSTTNMTRRLEIGENGIVNIGGATVSGTSYLLYVNGGIQAVSYNATSDKRLKTNVRIMDKQSEHIKRVNPVNFNWIKNPDSKMDYGFIAQDLYKEYPNLKAELYFDSSNNLIEEPVDSSGNPIYYSVDYGKLTCILWKGLTETMEISEKQEIEINELKKEMNESKNEINELKKEMNELKNIIRQYAL